VAELHFVVGWTFHTVAFPKSEKFEDDSNFIKMCKFEQLVRIFTSSKFEEHSHFIKMCKFEQLVKICMN